MRGGWIEIFIEFDDAAGNQFTEGQFVKVFRADLVKFGDITGEKLGFFREFRPGNGIRPEVGEFFGSAADRLKRFDAVKEYRSSAINRNIDGAMANIAADTFFVETVASGGIINVLAYKAFDKEHIGIL